MHRRFVSRLAAAALASVVTAAAADAPHQHIHAPQASKPAGERRQAVEFPPDLKEHTLANMRDHLLTLQRMHKSASRFALEAVNAGATGDHKAPLAALADLTAQCVACHAGYRFK
jgi:hypothetical protein